MGLRILVDTKGPGPESNELDCLGEVIEFSNATVFSSVDDLGVSKTAAGIDLEEASPSWRPWLWTIFPTPVLDLHRREELRSSGDIGMLRGCWVYLGPIRPHFGHILYEGVNRLWVLEQLQRQGRKIDGLLILAQQDNPQFAESSVRKVLSWLGFDPGMQIKSLGLTTTIENLIIAEPGRMAGAPKAGWYKQFLERRARKTSGEFPEKIFVSRRTFEGRGRLAGMNFLAQSLGQIGFVEFCPEHYPLETQLNVIENAKELVWEEGSAIHLLELIPSLSSRNTLIRRRAGGVLQALFSEVCTSDSASWHEVTQFGASPEDSKNELEFPYFVPKEAVIRFCEFLKDRTGLELDATTFLDMTEYDLRYFCKIQELEAHGLTGFRNATAALALRQCVSGFSQARVQALPPRANSGDVETGSVLVIDKPAPNGSTAILPPIGGYEIQGWALMSQTSSLVAKFSDGSSQVVKLNLSRPDVLLAMLRKNIFIASPEVGFRFVVPLGNDCVDLVIENDVGESQRIQITLSYTSHIDSNFSEVRQ